MRTRIALTGLIGAGKSTAVIVFRTLGIPCYDTDSNAKRLMKEKLRPEIESILGEKAYLSDGNLNKQYIAGCIFKDKTKRDEVNGIVHPAVMEDFITWSNSQDAPYVIAETALLIESGFDKIVDGIIVVTADTQERIQRTMARDHADLKSVIERIEAQNKTGKLLEIADFVIDNAESSMVIPQVLKIHKNIVTFAVAK